MNNDINMLERAIITPTFSGHFGYIKNYLKSFDRYLIDRDFPIFFIINKNENSIFSPIIQKYRNRLNLNVIFLDDIFEHFKIDETPEEALSKYGRLSFQTLKKFYGALYVNAKEFLFLDSESMLIKPTNISLLFDDYFKKPTFFISRISERAQGFKENFTYEFLNAVTNLLGKKPEYWSIESYEWFYKLDILKDLINDLGTPIEIVKNYKMPGKFPNIEGILEALLYYQYILYHNDKYGYTIKIIEDELREALGDNNYKRFRQYFDKSPFFICGVLETAMFFIDKDNADGFIHFLNKYKIRLLRVEDPKINNATAQIKIIKNTGIHICPSSQNHIFGINSTIKKRFNILIGNNRNIQKLKKHFTKFAKPFIFICKPFLATIKWTFEIIPICIYSLKSLNIVLKNLKNILFG